MNYYRSSEWRRDRLYDLALHNAVKASDVMFCRFGKKYAKNHKHWVEYLAESKLQGAGLLSLGYRNAAQSNC